ncbi:MAG: methyl-accepting chemotaxis protein [Clostridia bacterium]
MNLKIRTKLLLGFLTILILLVAQVVIATTQLKEVDSVYSTLISDRAQKAILTEKMNTLVQTQSKSIRGYLLLGNDSMLQEYTDASKKFDEIFQQMQSNTKSDQGQKLLGELAVLQKEYSQFAEKIFQLKNENRVAEYMELQNNTGVALGKKFMEKTLEMEQFQQQLLTKGSDETSAHVDKIKMLIITIGVVATVLGIGVALFMSRIITKPILTLAVAAERISSGDLTGEEIKVKSGDEIGELAHAFNTMKRNLYELIRKVGKGAEQLAASSEELYAGTEQVAAASTEVAEKMQGLANNSTHAAQTGEESARSVEEAALGVQRIAVSSSSVSESSHGSMVEAKQGHEAIQQVINQMSHIRETVHGSAVLVEELGNQSQQISQITQVISDITAQTNLLALNAAIEAARAGEHGRGFAVVADEVRKLAEESNESAVKIVRLIEEIQTGVNKVIHSMQKGTEEVETGVELIHGAGESFERILSSIQNVSSQIDEISATSEELSANTQQVAASAETMSAMAKGAAADSQSVAAVTEEQLASMEEIRAVSESLSRMALELQDAVRQFKV